MIICSGGLIGKIGSMKHSTMILFLFICGQAMYAYVMRPTSIPYSYYRFIRDTGPVDEYALRQVIELIVAQGPSPSVVCDID